MTFHAFLCSYKSPLENGDDIEDLARDVRNDPAAPTTDTELYEYLHNVAEQDTLTAAWHEFVKARASHG